MQAGSVQAGVVALAVAAMLGLGLFGMASAAMAGLFAVGVLLGVTLHRAGFGFASAFRVLLTDGQGAGARAILLMLGVACVLFYPTLGAGRGEGFVAPLDTALVVGAGLFGVGMQLGGGCGSGTLFAVGGGNGRMVLTLACFIAGSVLGVAHAPAWAGLPGWPAVSVIAVFGWPAALGGTLALLAAAWWAVAALERRRHHALRPITVGGHWRRDPWPLAAAAVALAVLNYATLLLAGRPWGITSAFGLWGGKLLAAGGIDLGPWGGWADPGQLAALARPLLADVTSTMDIGIMLGALAAAGLAGRFAWTWGLTRRNAASAVVGGLLMGYGARLASGCNIGALFSGVASGSLHGWVWLLCALAGSHLGAAVRPWFGMTVERRRPTC